MKNKCRDSNYELLRIISMLLIVLGHTIIHGNVLEHTTGSIQMLIKFIYYACLIHVSSFVLITGYYQSKSKFKFSKYFKLLLQVAFYNLVLNSILKFGGIVEYSNVEYIKSILFFNTDSYWFIKAYLILYLFSPFFNFYIEKCDKLQLKKTVLALIVICCLLPLISGNLLFSQNGSNLLHFTMLYFVGAYIRIYDLNTNLFKKLNVSQKRLLYLSIAVICLILNFSISYLKMGLDVTDSNILNSIAYIWGSFETAYNNPFIFIQTLSIFMLFGTFKFKNKFINKVASLSLGVYLIDDCTNIGKNLNRWIMIDTGNMITSKKIIIQIFLTAVILFALFALIEWIRQIIFKILSNLKIIEKIKKIITEWFNRIIKVS